MILVTTYLNPDLDGFAAALAYAEFLRQNQKEAQAGFLGRYNAEVLFAAQSLNYNLPSPLESVKSFDEIVLVDVSDLKRLEPDFPKEKVIEVIDHREVFDEAAFPRAQWQIDKGAVSATLVAEKFKEAGTRPSRATELLLLAAIACHTLNFQTATERDKSVFQWLAIESSLPSDFIRGVFTAKSDLEGEKLGQTLKDDFKWFEIGGRKLGVAQLQVVLAKALIEERKDEIVAELERIKTKSGVEDIFLAIQDLEEGATFFVAQDENLQARLAKSFDLSFQDGVAVTPKLLLRKYIVKSLSEVV